MKNPFAAAAAFAERLSGSDGTPRPKSGSAVKNSGRPSPLRVPSLRRSTAPAGKAEAPVSAPVIPSGEDESVFSPAPSRPAADAFTPRVTEERWGGMVVQTIELPASAFIRRTETPRQDDEEEISSRPDADDEPAGEVDFSYYNTPAALSPADTDGIIPDTESDDLTPAFLHAMAPEEEIPASVSLDEEAFSPGEDGFAPEGAAPGGEDEPDGADAPRPVKKKKIRVDIDVEETGSVLWAGAIFIGLAGTAAAFIAACFA